ncbi:MAG: ATP-binding protein [Verrucomicrobia bacterium]|nr:ATP-binding protein [Verrucomicrobiota bacterium]
MKRSYEELLGRYLEIFPCVVVIGVRQSGKTTLIRTLPEGWAHYDLERQADHEVVSRDPDAFFRLHPRQVALDEAQLVPGIFPALRVAIDEARDDKGRYVVTGSSSPELLRSVSESLAGRVGVIELAPFSWEEVTATGERESLVGRLADRRMSPAELVAGLGPRADVAQAHDFWFRGGFPEPWLNPGEEFRRLWVEQYLQAYVYRDVRRLFPGLDELRYRRFVGMLGGLSGKVLNYAEVARALQMSQPTVRDYFEIAHGTFVWRRVPAFTRDAMKRVVKHPKGYLRDSGLLHSLLRIPDTDALLSHPQMGASWAGMVVEEILRQLNARGMAHQYSHYRKQRLHDPPVYRETRWHPLSLAVNSKVSGSSPWARQLASRVWNRKLLDPDSGFPKNIRFFFPSSVGRMRAARAIYQTVHRACTNECEPRQWIDSRFFVAVAGR